MELTLDIGLQIVSCENMTPAVEAAEPAPSHFSREELVVSSLPEVAKVVAHYFRDGHDREEMMQDIAYRLLFGFASFKGRSPFQHWALAVASRACISRLRRRNIFAAVKRIVGQRSGSGEAESVEDPADDIHRNETRRLVRESIEGLKPKDREILLLSDILGKDDGEVAAILGIGAANLRVKRHRARGRLKDILLRRGYEPAG